MPEDAGPDEAGCRQGGYERLAEHVKNWIWIGFMKYWMEAYSMFCKIREPYPCLYCGAMILKRTVALMKGGAANGSLEPLARVHQDQCRLQELLCIQAGCKV